MDDRELLRFGLLGRLCRARAHDETACSPVAGSLGGRWPARSWWKMTVTTGSTSTWYLAAEKLAKDLEKETDGRITMKIFT
ncbi:hypothetical protein R0J89_18465, partial [Psychrobacter sp. SIMBA_152]